MKLTGTNRPTTYTTHHPVNRFKRGSPGVVQRNKTAASTMWFPNNKPVVAPGNKTQHDITTVQAQAVVTTDFPPPTPRGAGRAARVTAVIAWGKRPVPFRTRKLRPTAPMVLHPGGCGRVGHRRTTIKRKAPPTTAGPHPKIHPIEHNDSRNWLSHHDLSSRTVRRVNGCKGYGGHSAGETPGPIPNPEAKTHSADGTAPGRVWESRSPPEHH